MKLLLNITIAMTSIFVSATYVAAENQPRGHIFNVDGEKCTFQQSTASESYFHSIPANTGTLVFDVPTCMSTEGLSEDVNKMMIANFITRPYSHSDAAFQTRVSEFRNSSALQTRGVCIQSATYPTIGVVAEFQSEDGFIVSVKHAMSVQGCIN